MGKYLFLDERGDDGDRRRADDEHDDGCVCDLPQADCRSREAATHEEDMDDLFDDIYDSGLSAAEARARWESQPALLAACKGGLTVFDNHPDLVRDCTECREVRDAQVAAIALAEKEDGE